MSRKRRNTSSAEPESPPTKRRQSYDYDGPDAASDCYEQPQINAFTGLTNAFPGLNSDRDLFYGPAQNGLDYLRMVRSEAQGIPHLLTAPSVRHQEPRPNQEGFFDEDEAFIAAPIVEEKERLHSGAQAAYYKNLLVRFDRLRARMKATPSLDVIQSLPSTIPISFPTLSKIARKQWEEYLVNYSPTPVQISCMDWDSILELLKLITKKIRTLIHPHDDEDVRVRRFGTWLWAILAKCPDRGELGSEEISDLRACAKAADMALCWLQEQKDLEDTNDQHGDDSSDADTSDDVEEQEQEQMELRGALAQASNEVHDLQTHKSGGARGGRIPDISVRQNQHMILDMIITVVGETYGQRDLLDMRRPWSPATEC